VCGSGGAVGGLLERNLTDVESRLLLRCNVLQEAVKAGKRPHSELVRVLNGHRDDAAALALEPRTRSRRLESPTPLN